MYVIYVYILQTLMSNSPIYGSEMNTHIYLIELTEKLKYTSYTNQLPTNRNINGYQRTSQKSKQKYL